MGIVDIIKRQLFYVGLVVSFFAFVVPNAISHVLVNSPNGTEIFEVGSSQTIQWTISIGHDTQFWHVFYSVTGAAGPWIVIEENIPPGDISTGAIHTLEWTVPDDFSDQVRVQVVMDNVVGGYTDISDRDFSIVPSTERDTMFVSIDMVHYESVPDAIGTPALPIPELASIVVLCAIPQTGEHFVRLLSVDPETGGQLGEVVDIGELPTDCHPPEPGHPPDPGKVMISEHFLPGEIIVLNSELSLFILPLSFLPDGTPVRTSWECSPPPDDNLPWGFGTAIGEMPGSEFGDGMPRLFLGTDQGQIVVMMHDPTGGPVLIVSEVWDLTGGTAITSIGPIPQFRGFALGVSNGSEVMGVEPSPFAPSVLFQLRAPFGSPVASFVVPDLSPPPDDGHPVNIALVDGLSKSVKLASIPATAAGMGTLNIFLSPPPDDNFPSPIVEIAPGSLLMLTLDSVGLFYDPEFTDSTGLSGCIKEISDPLPLECNCCVGLTGNVDDDAGDIVDIGDLTALIDYLFISYTEPACLDEANCDGAGTVDIGDLTALIDYLFITYTLPAVCE